MGRIREKLWVLQEKKIGLWGLAFKQNTDDVRESVAIKLANDMMAEGADVTGWDPQGMGTAKRFGGLHENFKYGEDMYACLDGAEALIIGTEWPEFANADLEEIKKRMRTPLIFDGRNLYDPEVMAAHGIEYHSIGRASV